MNTEKIVRQAAKIFAEYGKEIRAMIALQAKDESVADDIFEDLFLSIVCKPVPADVQRVEYYLYRVIANDVIDAARRTKIYQDHVRGYSERIDRWGTQEDPRITFFNEDFSDVIAHVESLEDSANDQAQVLYHIMELETALGKLEEKARATNRRYEARLAASLRDICRVHEPGNISEKQVKHFAASASALVKGWGVLTREKVAYIRSRLLEVGLTWLPVTDKATSDIAKAETVTE